MPAAPTCMVILQVMPVGVCYVVCHYKHWSGAMNIEFPPGVNWTRMI